MTARFDCRRCDWQPSGDGPKVQLLEHALSTGHLLCIICTTSLPEDRPQTCLPCVASVRRDLATVMDLYALLPTAMAGAVYGQPGAPRDGDPSGERALPGGDRLAMLAPGARGPSGLSTLRRWVDRWTCRTCSAVVEDRARHMLEAHKTTAWTTAAERFDPSEGRWVEIGGPAEIPGDPEPVAFTLGREEDDWRITRGEPAATEVGTVAGAVDYLMPRLGWAADHHEGFDEFVAVVRRLVSRLRTATATDDRPERGAPCFSCSATLIRVRADRRTGHGCRGHGDRCPYPHEPHGCADTGGLPDEWKCPKCKRVYSGAYYDLAVSSAWQRAVKARRQEVGWTVRELAAELGITESGVRQIVRRHEIPRAGVGERNAALYDPALVREAAGSLRAG